MTFRIVTEPIDRWPLPDEEWRAVLSHPDYEVSNLGRVRRCTGGRGVRAGRVLVPQRLRHGYYSVNLYRQGVVTRRTLHRLVAEAFLGPSPLEVNHIDGIKAHNALANLEYATSSANKRHAVATGLYRSGERNAAAKLTDAQVAAIRAQCSRGLSQRAVARQFGITQGHVSGIVTGKKRAAKALGLL